MTFIDSKHMFILSPYVQDGRDVECSKDDFNKSDDNAQQKLGYIGSAWKVTHKKTKQLYSLKTIKKDKIDKGNHQKKLNIQLDQMYNVRHPFFLHLLNHFEDSTSLNLIFPYIHQTTIFEKIQENKLTMQSITNYFKEISIAVQYLHSFDIFDNTLEPEYILIDNDHIRLTDYGWSKVIPSQFHKRNGIKFDYVYANSYTPPELFDWNKQDKVRIKIERSSANKKSDIWQLGVLLYEMITKTSPFKWITPSEFYKKISEVNVDYSIIPKDYEYMKELIMKMIQKSPEKRIDIEEVLNTPWVKQIYCEIPIVELEEGIINNTTKFLSNNIQNTLRKENNQLKQEMQKLQSNYVILEQENIEMKKQLKTLEELSNKHNKEAVLQRSENQSLIRLLENEKAMTLSKEKQKTFELLNKITILTNQVQDKETANEELRQDLYFKIDNLEKMLFNPSNTNGTKDFLKYYLPIFNESVNNFKALGGKLIALINNSNEGIMAKYKDICSDKDQFIQEIQAQMNAMSDNKSLTANKVNLINEYKKEIEELSMYKAKYLNLEEAQVKILDEKRTMINKLLILEEDRNSLRIENKIITQENDTLKIQNEKLDCSQNMNYIIIDKQNSFGKMINKGD